ncbi:MAG: amidase [Phycisphaerales bacterium]|nr:amidase [Phycisphaerales bacterium]
MTMNTDRFNLPELATELGSGERSLDSFIDELEVRFNEIESDIMAFVEEPKRFERLRRDARALAERHPDPQDRPPLFGVPIAVKDIFNVAGFETRAGTTLPPETFEGPEAPSVTALRDAGALVLGKSVTTEFAYLANGPTRNPNDLEHTPGGSSSGSAAAVAAGLVPLAMGSQTVGSLIRPGAFCGVCAFKPTQARVPTTGVVPLAPSVDHVGLLAPDVASIEAGCRAMIDDWKNTTPDRLPTLGIPHEDYLAHAEDTGRAHFGMVCELLGSEGVELRKTDALAGFDALFERHFDLCAHEAARCHEAWRANWQKKYDPRTLKLLDHARNVNDARAAECLASCDALRVELERCMDEHGIDLWIAPAATGPAPLGIGSTGNGIMNAPWTHARMPTLGIPAGRTADGLPMGVQVSGRTRADEHVTAWGSLIEPMLGRH